MTQGRARVAVNDYGVIGKRVADAVALQDDMELVGVADVVHDYRIRVAVERGYPVYASVPEIRDEMEAAGVPVAGDLDEPETVDCIRALSGIEPDGAASIEKTDAAMGITKAFLPATTQAVARVAGPEVGHPALEAVRASHVGFRQTGFKGSEEPTDPEPAAEQSE